MPGLLRIVPLALIVLCAAAPWARAAAPAPPPVVAALAKIDPWVTGHATYQRAAEFIVVLRDQADLAPAERAAGKAARGAFVRNALYERARASQAPLLQWLAARGIPHRSFYIVNAILVTGTLPVAEQIAARSDVARIEGNPVISNLRPVVLTPEEISSLAGKIQSPQAIEPGVVSIRAPDVWSTGSTGQGIVIGGSDTGVQWDHPALRNHYRGWDGVTASHDYNWHDSVHSGGGACGFDSPAPCDDNNHGTHTLGTAVGSDGATNQIGVAPGAKFIACRNMNQGNGTPATYLECMEWFLAPYPVGGTPAQGDASKAPDITTNSWTCPPSEGCGPGTLQAAVEAQRAAGILFVAAAGNGGAACSTISTPPATYDASYTVGAYSAATGLSAGFTSRGPVTIDGSQRAKPDISAPGVSVRSAIRGGGYSALNGTSMATPHVAGAIALLWSSHPAMRNQIPETEMVLNQTAVDVDTAICTSSDTPNHLYGWGRIDIKAAVDRGLVSVNPADRRGVAGLWLAPPLPNPAHRSARFAFRLERAGEIQLAIYTSDGRRVRALARGLHSAGEHAIRWDGRNDRGQTASPGLYFVSLASRGAAATGKLIWLGR